MKIKHKIDFTKKLFKYENTRRKKEAGQSFHNANAIIKINYMHYQLKFEIRTISSYAGEFMNQYSWAENVTSFLDLKITKG